MLRKDAIIQAHKGELVAPLSDRTTMASIGASIARALATAKQQVQPVSLRRTTGATSPTAAAPAAQVPATTTRAEPAAPIIINATFNVTAEKGVTLAHAKNYGRVAKDAFEAELVESFEHGELGRRFGRKTVR